MNPSDKNYLAFECPIAVKWKVSAEMIKHFSQVSTNIFQASAFHDISYSINIFRNGKNRGERGLVALYVCFEPTIEENFETNFTFSIRPLGCLQQMTTIFDTYKLPLHSAFDQSCGFSICTFSDFFDPAQKYVIDGFCNIEVTGVIKRKILLPAPQKLSYLVNNLWEDEEKDFTIVIGGNNELKVHKNILRASSPVFAGMLKSGMKEAVENKVQIKGFDLEVIETAMKYCYGIKNFDYLSLDIKMSVFEFAEIYDIKDPRVEIEDYLKKLGCIERL